MYSNSRFPWLTIDEDVENLVRSNELRLKHSSEFLELRVGWTRRKLGARKQYSLNKPVHECCPRGRELRSIRDLTRVTRVTPIGRSCGTRDSSGGRKRKTELFEWIAGNGPWKGVSKRTKRRSWNSVMFERRYIASMEEKLINGTMRREEMEQRMEGAEGWYYVWK